MKKFTLVVLLSTFSFSSAYGDAAGDRYKRFLDRIDSQSTISFFKGYETARYYTGYCDGYIHGYTAASDDEILKSRHDKWRIKNKRLLSDIDSYVKGENWELAYETERRRFKNSCKYYRKLERVLWRENRDLKKKLREYE